MDTLLQFSLELEAKMFKWYKRKFSKKPWFDFTTDGKVDGDGRVKIKMDWNRAFINELIKMGIEGHSEEEIVHNYMSILTANQAPADPLDEDYPKSEYHPNLRQGHYLQK